MYEKRHNNMAIIIYTELDAYVIPEEMQSQFTLMHYHHKAGIALYTDAEGRKVIPKVAIGSYFNSNGEKIKPLKNLIYENLEFRPSEEWADFCLHYGEHNECNLIEELEKLEVVKYSYLEEKLV